MPLLLRRLVGLSRLPSTDREDFNVIDPTERCVGRIYRIKCGTDVRWEWALHANGTVGRQSGFADSLEAAVASVRLSWHAREAAMSLTEVGA
jgi:alkylhydroperoxidase family enzyme